MSNIGEADYPCLHCLERYALQGSAWCAPCSASWYVGKRHKPLRFIGGSIFVAPEQIEAIIPALGDERKKGNHPEYYRAIVVLKSGTRVFTRVPVHALLEALEFEHPTRFSSEM